jgi:nitroreductase
MTWTEDLRALAPLAARAPSPHNAQPWTVSYAESALTIGWDPARSLPVGDPTRRDLYLCLGGYVETWLIAAADAGLDVRAEIQVDETARTVARLVPADSRYATDFTADEIAARGCARGGYRTGRLDPEEIARARLQLTTAGLSELPAHELAGLAVRADRRLWSAPGVAAELRTWLRLTPRHPRYHQDGLTYEALAMSRAEALALRAVLAARASRPLAPLLASTQSGLLRGEGSVLVLSGSPDAAEDMVRAGRELLRVWYALAARGISVHPLSQLVDCAETERELRRRVGARPLAVFRAGRPVSAPPRSARLPSPPANRL